MIASFVAGGVGWELRSSIDFTQAFINVTEDHRSIFCELPKYTQVVRGGGSFGPRKRTRVAHMKRKLYGKCDGSRAWSNHLLKYLVDTFGVRVIVSDRCLFEWEWNGHKMVAGIFDDRRHHLWVFKQSDRRRVRSSYFCGLTMLSQGVG